MRCGTSIAALDRLSRPLRCGARFADQRDSRRHAAAPAGPCRRAGGSQRMRWSAGSSSALLPIARRDVERLQQILALQPRLLDTQTRRAHAARAAAPRGACRSVTWLEIHGDRPDVVAHWRGAAGGATRAASTPRLEDTARPPSARRSLDGGGGAVGRRRGRHCARPTDRHNRSSSGSATQGFAMNL